MSQIFSDNHHFHLDHLMPNYWSRQNLLIMHLAVHSTLVEHPLVEFTLRCAYLTGQLILTLQFSGGYPNDHQSVFPSTT